MVLGVSGYPHRMRVSPDGTFHGLRPSQGCRAACRIPGDPGLLNSRFVLLSPVADARTYISASPDLLPPGHRGGIHAVAADLQMTEALRSRIEEWISQFTDNFLHSADRPIDQPVWREGFDEAAWLERGHDLAGQLGEQYPEHLVCCCTEKLVVCEIASEQLQYACLLTGQYAREFGDRMPGSEPDPDVPRGVRIAPEYGLKWEIVGRSVALLPAPEIAGPAGFSESAQPGPFAGARRAARSVE